MGTRKVTVKVLKPHFSRDWRVLAQGPGGRRVDVRNRGDAVTSTIAERVVDDMRGGAEFDELVVGGWFHLERMDDRTWWMCVSGVHIWVRIPARGEPVVTITEMPLEKRVKAKKAARR